MSSFFIISVFERSLVFHLNGNKSPLRKDALRKASMWLNLVKWLLRNRGKYEKSTKTTHNGHTVREEKLRLS